MYYIFQNNVLCQPFNIFFDIWTKISPNPKNKMLPYGVETWHSFSPGKRPRKDEIALMQIASSHSGIDQIKYWQVLVIYYKHIKTNHNLF